MKKILIVEDEEIQIKMYGKKLTNSGYEVLKAGDGKSGLKKAIKEKPDLILLDIMMPKMNGVEMLDRLRQDPWGKRVPVVVLTNKDTDDSMLKEIDKNQPAYYLLKANLVPDDVIDKIQNIFKDKKN